jgi:hypothetical protein
MTITKPTLTWLAYGVVFAWYGHSCQTSSAVQTGDQFEIEGDQESFEDDESPQEPQKSLVKPVGTAHPKKADAWHTRKAIMTHRQPSPELVMACKETVESLTANASNLQALTEAAKALEQKVAKGKNQYHWCFYQLMTDLDLRLERDSPLLTDKKEAFLSRMRALVPLAKALDRNLSTAKRDYSSYLRQRYIEISQNQFGRAVEVIDSDDLLTTAGKSGKAAGPYDGP